MRLIVGLRRCLALWVVVLVLPAIAAAQASVTLNTYQSPVGTEVTHDDTAEKASIAQAMAKHKDCMSGGGL